jgi:chaperone modulatory protein CbpM
MMTQDMTQEILIGSIAEETIITLPELSQICSVQTDYIIELVTEGILDIAIHNPLVELESEQEPEPETEQWCFTGNCIQRVHISLRLQRDLDINLAGVALMLDFLEK